MYICSFTQCLVQGIASHLDWRRVSSLLLGLHLSTPGLQLRLLSKQEDAATHVINTARVRDSYVTSMLGKRSPAVGLLRSILLFVDAQLQHNCPALHCI